MLKFIFTGFCLILLQQNVNAKEISIEPFVLKLARAVNLNNSTEVNAFVDATLSEEKLQRSVDFFSTKIDNRLEVLQNVLRTVRVSKTFIEILLKSRGTNLEEVQENIRNLQNSPEKQIEYLNEVLNANLTRIEGDVIKVNYEQLEILMREALNLIIHEKFSGNFIQQMFLIKLVNDQIKLQSDEWKREVESQNFPIANLKNSVNSRRSKRNLFDDLFGGLFNFVNDLLINTALNLIRQQLEGYIKPIQVQVNTVLENITSWLIVYVKSEEPEDPIASIIAHTINVGVKRALQLIGIVQSISDEVFDFLLNSNVQVLNKNINETENVQALSRQKRDIKEGEGEDEEENVNDVLEYIWSELIVNNLNIIFKTLIQNWLRASLHPFVIILSAPLLILLNFIIDLALPCSTCISL